MGQRVLGMGDINKGAVLFRSLEEIHFVSRTISQYFQVFSTPQYFMWMHLKPRGTMSINRPAKLAKRPHAEGPNPMSPPHKDPRIGVKTMHVGGADPPRSFWRSFWRPFLEFGRGHGG